MNLSTQDSYIFESRMQRHERMMRRIVGLLAIGQVGCIITASISVLKVLTRPNPIDTKKPRLEHIPNA